MAVGWARVVVPLESTIVIDWALVEPPPVKVLMFPVLPLIDCAPAVNGIESDVFPLMVVAKCVSRPLDGPSITHSTEVRRAFLENCVVVKELPVLLLVR